MVGGDREVGRWGDGEVVLFNIEVIYRIINIYYITGFYMICHNYSSFGVNQVQSFTSLGMEGIEIGVKLYLTILKSSIIIFLLNFTYCL